MVGSQIPNYSSKPEHIHKIGKFANYLSLLIKQTTKLNHTYPKTKVESTLNEKFTVPILPISLAPSSNHKSTYSKT